jgi:hypothetical protein
MGPAMILLGAYMLGVSLGLKVSLVVAGVGGFLAILGGTLALYEPILRVYWSFGKPKIIANEPIFVMAGRCRRCGGSLDRGEEFCSDCAHFLKRLSRV